MTNEANVFADLVGQDLNLSRVQILLHLLFGVIARVGQRNVSTYLWDKISLAKLLWHKALRGYLHEPVGTIIIRPNGGLIMF